jgi:gliding motility-associated-like protein
LSVNPNLTAIQWYNGSSLIPGATSALYQPYGPGSFWAQVSQAGCTDTTARISISVYELPLASFTVNKDTACVTNNNFLFTNTSSIVGAATLTHTWKYSDGVTQVTTNGTKTFTNPGRYNVELHTVSSEGCRDTAYSTVYVMANALPNFTWDSICTAKPVLFRNLSNNNGASAINYVWNFDNGSAPINIVNPAPVTYTTAGQANVSLKVTSLGCESDTVSITKPVNVNQTPASVRYKSLTVPQGSSAFIHVRDFPGGVFDWKPKSNLSRYNNQYTEFYATTNDITYLIDIWDKHNCFATDTMLIQVLKKPGFYLPTAFTPNRDGLNDVVKPYLVGMKSLKSFSIFNRWGDRIFFTAKYGEGWDGKINGVTQNGGVYVWILEFYDTTDKLIVEKGTITLIR